VVINFDATTLMQMPLSAITLRLLFSIFVQVGYGSSFSVVELRMVHLIIPIGFVYTKS